MFLHDIAKHNKPYIFTDCDKTVVVNKHKHNSKETYDNKRYSRPRFTALN